MRLTTLLAVLSMALIVFMVSCTPPPPQRTDEGQNGAAVTDQEPVPTEGEEAEEGFTESSLPDDWVEEVVLPPGAYVTDYSKTENSMHASGYVERPIDGVFAFASDIANFPGWTQARLPEWVREGSTRKAFYSRPHMNLEINLAMETEIKTLINLDLTME